MIDTQESVGENLSPNELVQFIVPNDLLKEILLSIYRLEVEIGVSRSE